MADNELRALLLQLLSDQEGGATAQALADEASVPDVATVAEALEALEDDGYVFSGSATEWGGSVPQAGASEVNYVITEEGLNAIEQGSPEGEEP